MKVVDDAPSSQPMNDSCTDSKIEVVDAWNVNKILAQRSHKDITASAKHRKHHPPALAQRFWVPDSGPVGLVAKKRVTQSPLFNLAEYRQVQALGRVRHQKVRFHLRPQ